MSICLARYAAAQLESAALIPTSAVREGSRGDTVSLLRRELRNSPNSSDSLLVLTRVSRAMMIVLAGQGSTDKTVSHLIRHEAAASRQLRALSAG